MKAILFDLDGTLLPMDQELFVEKYLKLLAKWMTKRGYDPEKLAGSVWKGTAAMMKNDGSKMNEECFWQVYADIHGEEALRDRPFIDEFYLTDFELAHDSCGFTPSAKKVIEAANAGFDKVILATNPIFPRQAQFNRIRWAGLEHSDFTYITSFENSSFCKPKQEYYKEILDKMGLEPKDCIMVGNDVDEDMIPGAKLGMKVFLIKDCLINRSGSDISGYPQGSLDDLLEWLGK